MAVPPTRRTTTPAPSAEAVLTGVLSRQVTRRLRRVVVPLLGCSFAWYFGYVLLAAFAPGLMARPVLGLVNVGLVLGVSQFVVTFAVVTCYSRWAASTLDPMTDQLRRQVQEGRSS